MGFSVLILGKSGQGKSTSMRNFKPGEIGIFNTIGKPLPFRNKLDMVDHPTYETIYKSLTANNKNCYVLDDVGYLLQLENIHRADESGWGKYMNMQAKFAKILEAANHTDSNTIVYFMMHPEFDNLGNMKPKTIGKLLDEKLDVAGMFPMVMIAERAEEGYCFVTQSDGKTPAKTPMGMFDDDRIDNDLKLVDSTIREYYGMAPLGAAKKEA